MWRIGSTVMHRMARQMRTFPLLRGFSRLAGEQLEVAAYLVPVGELEIDADRPAQVLIRRGDRLPGKDVGRRQRAGGGKHNDESAPHGGADANEWPN